ncbi:unnamed protein product [Closterium sp. Yama58-4]|nr:unnamed protein product [Closterium sp. Yama58-4]
MFSKELVGRAFQFMEEGIAHPRYSAAECRHKIRGLMCEAGEGKLLESLALKGAVIPPQSDCHGGDESDSDQGVEEIKEPTIQDVAAEQCCHAAQLKCLQEDMESLKDAVYNGEKGLDKVTQTLSSLFTSFQQMAAKIGFKQPSCGLENLNGDEPTASTAAAPPPHSTAGASFEAPVAMGGVPHATTSGPSHARATIEATTPGYGQGQGATPGALKTAAGHSSLAAVPSGTTHGAPDGALPSAPGQLRASAGAWAAGVGQPGARAVIPASAGTLPGVVPAAAAGQTGAAGGVQFAPTGHTGAAAGVPIASTGQTGAAASSPTAAAGHGGPATSVPSASAGHATASVGVPSGSAGLGCAAANLHASAAASGSAGTSTAATGQRLAGHGVPSVPESQTGAVGVAPTPAHAVKDATMMHPVSYAPGTTLWARGVEARAQAASGRPFEAAVDQPRNDAWDLVGPPTALTMFHRGVQLHGAHGSDAAANTARASAPQRGSSVWSSGEQFFAPSAFPPGAHMQGVPAPSPVGFAQHPGAVPPASSASAAHSWPIGHAQAPAHAVCPGSGQPNDFVQLPLSTLRPPLHQPAKFLAADEVLDNTSCHRGQTSESRGFGLSTMLVGSIQGSQQVLPSPAVSSSMVPTTQGAGNGEVPSTKGWTGVTKKEDKDEWIGRIILDRASTSLIVINSHFESEEAAARSIAAASHVMFVDKPTRGDLIPLIAADKDKLRGCTVHQYRRKEGCDKGQPGGG